MSIASLSLDLDNKWSYLKIHGDEGWQAYPSYLDLVVPRVLDILGELDQSITFFIVGQDAAREENHGAIGSLANAGHEIANHSFKHEPWLHLYSEAELHEELETAETHIRNVTGQQTIGFRGPGFSLSETVLKVLNHRGYEYDCSTFPTFLGPVARAYYFMTAKNLSKEEKAERKRLFGRFSEGFRPLRPFAWEEHDDLIEVPVTTMPVFKLPFHLSYLMYLASYSRHLAMAYYRWSIMMCRITGVEPSLLLHPLDFMGAEDDKDLGFFPAMGMPYAAKEKLAKAVLSDFCGRFEVLTMRDHAARHATTSSG